MGMIFEKNCDYSNDPLSIFGLICILSGLSLFISIVSTFTFAMVSAIFRILSVIFQLNVLQDYIPLSDWCWHAGCVMSIITLIICILCYILDEHYNKK